MSGWNDHQQKVVNRVISDWKWLIDREWLEWYYSGRPYQRVGRRPIAKFNGDCTGTIKLVNCDWNGIPPWDGEALGYGNTRTFANQTKKGYFLQLNPKEWQPLDILLYKHHSGPFIGGSHEHAAQLIYKENGVWIVASMGSDSGPKAERWNYRNDLAKVLRFPIPLK